MFLKVSHFLLCMDDEKYMRLALDEANNAYKRGDLPIGAVLVVEDKVFSGSNKCKSLENWLAHAEAKLLHNNAVDIKKAVKQECDIHLYTTLEPCLMCLGTIVLTRIPRIVYACPDPNGGACNLMPGEIKDWYIKRWPLIEQGHFREESYNLLTAYFRENKETWGKVLKKFEEVGKSWIGEAQA